MDFGEKILQLRMEKGIYQKELAAYLQVSVGTVCNYELGVHHPDYDTLCKLADYYGVSVDYLLGRTQFRGCLDSLNHPLTDNYTVSDLLNTSLQLDPPNAHALVEYVNLLKLKQQHNES